MRVSPIISVFTKYPLIWLFICSFILAKGMSLGKGWLFLSQYAQCRFPLTFYDIKNEREVVLTKGIYRVYHDGFNHVHTSYIGTLSRFADGVRIAPVINVHRVISFEGNLHYNQLEMTAKNISRGLGDNSHDNDVREYVFPFIKLGDASIIGLYLLNGKVLASGTENAPRNICYR